MPESIDLKVPLKKLIELSNIGISNLEVKNIPVDDHVSAICSAFFTRQVEYATAFVLLLNVHQVASAVLTVRTMVEGAACLWWVMNSEYAYARALNWRKHVYHESLKAPEGFEADNEKLSNIYKIKAEAQRLKDKGQHFKEGRWTIDEKGKRLNPKQLIEGFLGAEKSKESHFYTYYQLLSAFPHWSPAAFTIDDSDPTVWRNAAYPDFFKDKCTALALMSLHQVLKDTDSHLEIGIFGE